MRHSIKMVLAVLLTVIMFSAVQVARAGGPEIENWLDISGTIDQIYPKDSTIVIISDYDNLPYTITGFPFGYLENELDSYFESELAIEIKKGDCVTIDYAVVVCKAGTKNIAVALTRYCEDCGNVCYEDDEGFVLRDEDFYPVDKSRNDDDSDHYHHHKHPDSDG